MGVLAPGLAEQPRVQDFSSDASHPALAPLSPGDGTSANAPHTPSSTSPSGLSWGEVGALVVSVLAAGGGAYTVGRSHAVKIEPQPLEVTALREHATREELEQLRSYFNVELTKTNKRLDRALESVSDLSGTIRKMDGVQQQILTLLLKHHE